MIEFGIYSKSVESGIDWLGDIPEHWVTLRLKFIFNIQKRIAGEIGYDVLSITNKGIKLKDIESGEGQLSMDYSKYQLVDIGDFAMNHMDLLTGYVDISDFNGVTSPDYRVFCISDNSKFHSRYYLHLLQLGYKQKLFFHLGQGSAHLGRWRLPTESFNNIVYPVPPIDEQIKIANFLDHETAKIDTLIEKQQQLIKLLKEKRQAVISHAVTKGLNPDVPMKDSGVEWLGEVPANWEMKRLKYIGEASNGLTYSPSDIVSEAEGVLVLRSSNIQNAKLSFVDNVYVKMAIPERIKTQENDLLICSRNGSKKLIGKNALITEDAIGVAFGAFMIVFRSRVNTYLYWVLNSPLFEYQSSSFLTSTINQLTIGNLGSMEIPLPPSNEQEQIIQYLTEKDAYFDLLSENAARKVEILQERRSALISAAVTGIIDVRNWKPTDNNNTEEVEVTA